MTLPDPYKKTGDILLEEGLISSQDVDQVLAIQKKGQAVPDRGRLFGMVLCDLNLVTPMDNYCALDRHGKLLSLGDYLVRKNLLTRPALEDLNLRAQAADLPLISLLLDQGVLTKPQLQQVLFDLFYIPFRSVSDLVFDKGARQILSSVIDRKAAEENRCIPLQLAGNTLMVGITDPANLVFLKGLDSLFPQYRFNPIFIPFSGFTWFYRLLYEKDWEKGAALPMDRPMGSAIVIQDPESERAKILALFDRYEEVARQNRGAVETGRQDLFLDFVAQHHRRICAHYHCRKVSFSLKLSQNRIMVLAKPEKGVR